VDIANSPGDDPILCCPRINDNLDVGDIVFDAAAEYIIFHTIGQGEILVVDVQEALIDPHAGHGLHVAQAAWLPVDALAELRDGVPRVPSLLVRPVGAELPHRLHRAVHGHIQDAAPLLASSITRPRSLCNKQTSLDSNMPLDLKPNLPLLANNIAKPNQSIGF
jgi:hypothetical protein